MAKKAVTKGSTRSRRSEPKGPDINTSADVVDQRPAPSAKAIAEEDAARKDAFSDVRDPIPQQPNPPPQPAMIPAKQIEGASNQALDPDDLPANRHPRVGTIRVQAKALGYYGDVIRRVGDVFDIANEKEFSTKWMRRVSTHTPEKVTGSNAALARAKQGEKVNEQVADGAADDNVLGD